MQVYYLVKPPKASAVSMLFASRSAQFAPSPGLTLAERQGAFAETRDKMTWATVPEKRGRPIAYVCSAATCSASFAVLSERCRAAPD